MRTTWEEGLVRPTQCWEKQGRSFWESLLEDLGHGRTNPLQKGRPGSPGRIQCLEAENDRRPPGQRPAAEACSPTGKEVKDGSVRGASRKRRWRRYNMVYDVLFHVVWLEKYLYKLFQGVSG